MGIFDIFRAVRDVESVRLRLHFVHAAYEAAREVVDDARLHWWDRDDGTVDISGDGANAVGARALAAAQAVIEPERARAATLIDERAARVLLARLAALATETPPDPANAPAPPDPASA